MKTALSFDDVLLVPDYNAVPSRSDVSLTTEVAGLDLELPIIAANMPSVCEWEMTRAMGIEGGLGIVHRMQDVSLQCSDIEKARDGVDIPVGAAIGIGDDWERRAACLIGYSKVDIICLDVAHGHQARVIEVALEFLDKFDTTPLIIGNIATSYAASYFLQEINEDDYHRVALKVGVGGGSVCTTRIKTGFGMPTLQSVLDVYEAVGETDVSIIADGGIKTSGDIVKCLAAGADAVMLGSLLAGTREAPGEVIKDDKTGLKYKVYRGAASYGAKEAHFGEAEYVEGAERLVPYKGRLEKNLNSLCDGIRSGLTYCGVEDIYDLRDAEFVRITPAGFKESLPHGVL